MKTILNLVSYIGLQLVSSKVGLNVGGRNNDMN